MCGVSVVCVCECADDVGQLCGEQRGAHVGAEYLSSSTQEAVLYWIYIFVTGVTMQSGVTCMKPTVVCIIQLATDNMGYLPF